MSAIDTDSLVQFLRDEMLKAYNAAEKYEGVEDEKSKGFRMYWHGHISAIGDALRKLVELGAELKPDAGLIVEAETLIPKGEFWCNHELNRTLRFYQEAYAKKDYADAVLCERTIRKHIVKARLEAAANTKPTKTQE